MLVNEVSPPSGRHDLAIEQGRRAGHGHVGIVGVPVAAEGGGLAGGGADALPALDQRDLGKDGIAQDAHQFPLKRAEDAGEAQERLGRRRAGANAQHRARPERAAQRLAVLRRGPLEVEPGHHRTQPGLSGFRDACAHPCPPPARDSALSRSHIAATPANDGSAPARFGFARGLFFAPDRPSSPRKAGGKRRTKPQSAAYRQTRGIFVARTWIWAYLAGDFLARSKNPWFRGSW